MRWSIEKRLEFIEVRIFWEGRLNRQDLVEAFQVSTQQASADIARYMKLAPGNLVFDRSSKSYVRGHRFKARLGEPDAGRCLSGLRLSREGIDILPQGWIEPPPYEMVPVLPRLPAAERLRDVLDAIREGLAIEIRYQSMSSDRPQWRWVAPHAIAFDGMRWHARCLCLRDETFKDFSLARMLDGRKRRAHGVDTALDLDWHELVELVIAPDPALSRAQARAVALEYGMTRGELHLTVRRAFVFYVLWRLGIASSQADPSGARPGGRPQRLVLVDASPPVASPAD
ncbi:MAG: WYL domain-containing protein [Methylocystis sp.]